MMRIQPPETVYLQVGRLIILSLAFGAAIVGTSQEQASPNNIELLVRQLGSSDPRERELASAELLRRGKEMRPRLLLATKERDPEIAARARDLLDRIRRQPQCQKAG